MRENITRSYHQPWFSLAKDVSRVIVARHQKQTGVRRICFYGCECK
jgi:hypothetical protein